MKIYVLTSDPYRHHIEEFARRFNQCLPEREVIVAGFSPLGFELPSNFSFLSLGEKQISFADGMLDLLDLIPDRYFILMLEDYFMIDINKELLSKAEQFAVENKVGRFCLEKIHWKKEKERYYWEDYIGIWARRKQYAPYLLALEPSIWDKEMYKKYLLRGEDAWQTEVNSSKRARNMGELVLAPKVPIMRYHNYINKGNVRKNWDKIVFGS